MRDARAGMGRWMRVVVAIALLSMLLPASPAWAAVAFDAVTTSLNNGALDSPKSFSHTTTGSNRALVVFVVLTGTAQTVSSITYNSVALTFFNAFNLTGTPTARLEAWALSNPASGANNVTVTLSAGNADWDIIAESFTGAHQTTTSLLTSWQTAQSLDATITTATVTSASGDMVIDASQSTGNNGTTSGTGQTQRWQDNTGGTNTQGSTKAGPDTTMAESWDSTCGASDACHGVAAMNVVQVVAAAGGVSDEDDVEEGDSVIPWFWLRR